MSAPLFSARDYCGLARIPYSGLTSVVEFLTDLYGPGHRIGDARSLVTIDAIHDIYRICEKVRLITSRIRRGLDCASGLHRCPSNSRSQPQTNNGPAHIKPRNFAKS